MSYETCCTTCLRKFHECICKPAAAGDGREMKDEKCACGHAKRADMSRCLNCIECGRNKPAAAGEAVREVKLVPWKYVYKHQWIDGPFWSENEFWNAHRATESMPLYWGADVDALAARVERLERELADTLRHWADGSKQLQRECESLRKDAGRFHGLQNMPREQAQAFFWTYSSRRERAKAIDSAMSAAGATAPGTDP